MKRKLSLAFCTALLTFGFIIAVEVASNPVDVWSGGFCGGTSITALLRYLLR